MTNAAGFIDVHAHFLTDFYLEQARGAGQDHPDGLPSWPTWSATDHLAMMDRHGITTSILSMSSPGVHFGDDRAARALARSVNEAGAAVVAAHPGRFGLFAVLPLPDVEGSLIELEYSLDTLGADGVVLMTNAHGAYLGDESFEPLFAELSRHRAVAFLHPTSPACWHRTSLGRPRAMVEFIFDTARTVTDLLLCGVLERHPGAEVIVPHCGGALPVLADRIDAVRRIAAPTDSSPSVVEQLSRLHYDLAGQPFPRQIPGLLNLVGADRLLYGSDYSWVPSAGVGAQVAALHAADIPGGASSWEALTTANALRLFPALARSG